MMRGNVVRRSIFEEPDHYAVVMKFKSVTNGSIE